MLLVASLVYALSSRNIFDKIKINLAKRGGFMPTICLRRLIEKVARGEKFSSKEKCFLNQKIGEGMELSDKAARALINELRDLDAFRRRSRENARGIFRGYPVIFC